MIEPQVLGLLTKLFLLGSQYCFLLAHRMILMKKNVFWKKYYTFLRILHFRLLSENNRCFLSKIFRLVFENCSHRDLKRVVENYISLKNTIFVSFCMVSFGDWTKTFGVSTKKSAGLSKLHSLIRFSPYERSLRKIEIFQKKSVFYQFGTWGKN